MRKIVQKRESFELRSGALRIVAVADTHSRPHPDLGRHIERYLRRPASGGSVDALAPDRIVHAGDIGSETVLRDLEKLAPVTAVRGNIDSLGEPDVVTIDVRDDGRTLLTMLLLHIAVNGPRLRPDVVRLAKREGASLVVCGHSHVPFANHDHGVTVFNPGSAGPKRFHLPILFGVIDVRRDGVSVQHVDCETGRPWKPTSSPRT